MADVELGCDPHILLVTCGDQFPPGRAAMERGNWVEQPGSAGSGLGFWGGRGSAEAVEDGARAQEILQCRS